MLNKKDFDSIRVSDITKQAAINRSTYYAHFPDKFSLVDGLLSAGFMDFVYRRVGPEAVFSEETLKNIVIALCEYHQASNNRCIKSYDTVAPFIEKNLKIQLEQFIYELLGKSWIGTDKQTLHTTATFITWSIYGSTFRWNSEGGKGTPQSFANQLMPLLSGVLHAPNSNEQQTKK